MTRNTHRYQIDVKPRFSLSPKAVGDVLIHYVFSLSYLPNGVIVFSIGHITLQAAAADAAIFCEVAGAEIIAIRKEEEKEGVGTND